jgi:pimeloyl-ACP methyl ester carboxylesterase
VRAGEAISRLRRRIVDDGTYAKLTVPVLGLGGPGYSRLKAALDAKAPGSRTVRMEGSGHFIAEEKPAGSDAKFPLELKVHSRNELQRVGAR